MDYEEESEVASQVKSEHRLNAQLEEDLLRVDEYQEEALVCETEHGPFLSEDENDAEEKHVESFVHCLEDQHQEMMPEASKEAMESHVFEIDNLCECMNCSYGG